MCDGLTDELCLKRASESGGLSINNSAGQSANSRADVDWSPARRRRRLAGGCTSPRGESRSRRGTMVPVAVARASLSALMALFTAEAPLRACLCECVIRVALSHRRLQTRRQEGSREEYGRQWSHCTQSDAVLLLGLCVVRGRLIASHY